MSVNIPRNNRKRIIIIGGGFAGINVLNHLRKSPFQLVLLDKNNHHTFQPLLYQVATSGLEAGSIAYPLRKIISGHDDFHVRMTEVKEIRPADNCVHTSIGDIEYDYLVIATGSTSNYFRMEDVQQNSLPLKSVAEAIDMRHHILQCFETALLYDNPEDKQRMMNFLIAGAGPTGVELAGALSELRRNVLPKDYPELDLGKMRIVIADPGKEPLSAMSDQASKYSRKYLADFGVEFLEGIGVKSYDGQTAILSDDSKFHTETLIWAAGVMGTFPKGFDKAIVARGNRLMVDEFNRLQGFENIFAIGDAAQFIEKKYPNGLPMLAPVAIQQGKHLAKNMEKLRKGDKLEPFSYFDKGSLATVGRKRAVADLPKNIHFHGFIAWVAWLFVHLFYLIGFRNKMTVLADWIWNYITFDRRVRLIVRPYLRRQSRISLPKEPAMPQKEPASSPQGIHPAS
jgi:NADH dehydrogenase